MMIFTLFITNTKPQYLNSRVAAIEKTLNNSLNVKMSLVNEGIQRGVKAISDWGLFVNMTGHQFNTFLILLGQINSLNLIVSFGERNGFKESESNFVKLLVFCSVFPSYMNTTFMSSMQQTVINGVLDPYLLFSKIFDKYKISSDFTLQTEMENIIYEDFTKATFSRLKYIEFDGFTTFNNIQTSLGIRNGKNIRKINSTSYAISKKESFYFHNQDGLLDFDDEEDYIKRRIIASKLAVLSEEVNQYFITTYLNLNKMLDEIMSFIQSYLRSNRTFTLNIDSYYSDFEFWKSGFRILLNSDCRDYHIRAYVDYLEFQKTHLGADFSLKGRTYTSILRDIELWHRTITYEQIDGEPIVWGQKEEGVLKTIKVNDRLYEYKEIIDSHELFIEGKKKCHCVYTYLDSCVNKRIQIWRLNEANTNKGLTIQVKNSKIVQARGKFNAIDEYLEKNVLTVMAKKENLTISI